MIFTHESLTPEPQYPTYPPYHKGPYLEDYFRERFISESPDVGRDYIGISWTTLYCDNKYHHIQAFLDSLPRDRKYFTVSQHDDAPAHRLPPDTLCFSAGGNVRGANIIPIPLICSPLPVEIVADGERPILASFIGSNTHRVRQKITETYKDSEHIRIFMKGWTPSVSDNDFLVFTDMTKNSKFCICPRGYGLNSFRLYEAMQLGAIPIIVTDEFYLPWADEIKWCEFSELVSEDMIYHIEKLVLSYSKEQIQIKQNRIKELYPKYFSMDGMYQNIIKRLK
jgi:hypothetical protein